MAGDGRDVDDTRIGALGGTIGQHDPRRSLGGEEDAPDVDVEGLVPGLDGKVQGLSLTANAGVIDQDRYRSEGRFDLFEGGRDRLSIRHVKPHGHGPSARSGDLACEGFNPVEAPGSQGDGSAFGSQKAREMAAKAA